LDEKRGRKYFSEKIQFRRCGLSDAIKLREAEMKNNIEH
jgi:hypothetical protein